MLHSIWSEQICLAAKILHRADKECYCQPILEEQVYMSWNGLAKEAGEISMETVLPDVRRVGIPRKKVKEAAMYYSVADRVEEGDEY